MKKRYRLGAFLMMIAGGSAMGQSTGTSPETPKSDNVFALLKKQNREIQGKLTVEASIVQEGWVALHEDEPGVDPFRVYGNKRSATLKPWWQGWVNYTFSPVKNLKITAQFGLMPETDQSVVSRVYTNEANGYDYLFSSTGYDYKVLNLSYSFPNNNYMLSIQLQEDRRTVRMTTLSNSLLTLDLPGETTVYSVNGYLLDPTYNTDLDQANQKSYSLRAQRLVVSFTNQKPMLVEPWMSLILESIEKTYVAFGQSNLDSLPANVYGFSPSYLKKRISLAAAAGVAFRPNNSLYVSMYGTVIPNETSLNAIQGLYASSLGAVPMGNVLSGSFGLGLELRLDRAGHTKVALNYDLDISSRRIYPGSSTIVYDWAVEYSRNLGILMANERDLYNQTVKLTVTFQ